MVTYGNGLGTVEAVPTGDRLGSRFKVKILSFSFILFFSLEIESKVWDGGIFTVSIKFSSYIVNNQASLLCIIYPHQIVGFFFHA